MKEEISNLRTEMIAQIMSSKSISDLENIRANYLGKNGKLTTLVKNLSKIPKDERRTIGITINETKKAISKVLGEQKNKLSQTTDNWFDPTIPTSLYKTGKNHPTTSVINDIFKIFTHLGFSVITGPEIETDEYNFARLNLPKDHPARSLQDALYINKPEVVLRTHTSSVESRALAKLQPPFRVIVAGKCYRYENVNASNNAMFYQFQGFAMQEGLSMADLKGTLYYFVEHFFGKNRKIRYRCKYYPEVEPGVGLDIDCPFCKQKGCSVCKQRGWLEMLGAGMIHPNMIKQAGLNPQKISGFAFGIGLDRVVMDRFNISDIRSLYNGDIKY